MISAGNSRRARRFQNSTRSIRPELLYSLSSKSGDQEAGQHEEQIDTQVSAGQPMGVERDNNGDSDAA